MISCNYLCNGCHSVHLIAFKAIVFCGTSGELLLWSQATSDSQIRERNGRGGRFQKSLVESLFPFPLGSPCAFVFFLPRKVLLALYHLFIRCIACNWPAPIQTSYFIGPYNHLFAQTCIARIFPEVRTGLWILVRTTFQSSRDQFPDDWFASMYPLQKRDWIPSASFLQLRNNKIPLGSSPFLACGM